MSTKNIEKRVAVAAGIALHDKGYVSVIDVFMNMGWLCPRNVLEWRRGMVPYLEKVIHANLSKISRALAEFRKWVCRMHLNPSETAYLRRTIGPQRDLKFSKSGNPHIEQAYRTHFVSRALKEKKAERLKERQSKPPELVAYMIINDSKCSLCGEHLLSGSFLIMEADKPLCMSCAGLGGLVFLPSGDAAVTRAASKKSGRRVVVVRFSRSRKRYERQGILVDADAIPLPSGDHYGNE